MLVRCFPSGYSPVIRLRTCHVTSPVIRSPRHLPTCHREPQDVSRRRLSMQAFDGTGTVRYLSAEAVSSRDFSGKPDVCFVQCFRVRFSQYLDPRDASRFCKNADLSEMNKTAT